MADIDRVLAKLRSAGTQARARQKHDTERRESAKTILLPGEVAGEYDPVRQLMTTVGSTGTMRPLTIDDLRTFSRNVKQAGKKYKGGITAKLVIEMSAAHDRDLANKQIFMAVPVSHRAGRVHFVTNAGPHSRDSRHHVHVEFMEYANAISAPVKKLETLAKQMADGRLKFDCDCGRHTFWYRYISTIGGFNAGRPEQGYPKIRNPNLHGVACKHVLRVMKQIGMPNVRAVLVKMIDQGRANVRSKTVTLSKAELEKIAEQQVKRRTWKTQQVETSAERATRTGKKAVAAVVERKRAEAKKPGAPKPDLRQYVLQTRMMVAAGLLTAKEGDALIAKIDKRNGIK